MLSTYFKNYEEFKSVFENKENGQRKNKIFLQAYKHACKTKRRVEFEQHHYSFSLNELIKSMNKYIMLQYENKDYRFKLLGETYFSNKFNLDGNGGICEDLDCKSIRYITDGGRVYKMKAGKFIRSLLEENGVIDYFGETICNYYCEQFTEEWQRKNSDITCRLKVDDDFEFIYSSKNFISDNFGSCMTDSCQHSFYNDAVDASAASIISDDGLIIARCVIFNKVDNLTDKVFLRIAERQYAAGNNKMYMQKLINMLIEQNYIDGYKTIGAGCGDARSFILNNGDSLYNKNLRISCSLYDGDTISYQDSFKWYDIDGQYAYNYEEDCSMYDLGTTENEFYVGSNYDEYNDEYTNDDLVTIMCWDGIRYSGILCSENYASDNFYWSNHCDMYLNEAYRSDILNDYLPLDKHEELEEEYKAENWEYDEYNEEYTDDNTIECYIFDNDINEYKTMNVSEYYVYIHFKIYDGEYYDVLDGDVPYGIDVKQLIECD